MRVLTSNVEREGTSLGSPKLSIMAFFSFWQEVSIDTDAITMSMIVTVSGEIPIEWCPIFIIQAYCSTVFRLVQTAFIEPHLIECQPYGNFEFIFGNQSGRSRSTVGIAECNIDDRFVSLHGYSCTQSNSCFPQIIVSGWRLDEGIWTSHAQSCPITDTLEKFVRICLREKFCADSGIEIIVEIRCRIFKFGFAPRLERKICSYCQSLVVCITYTGPVRCG